MYGLDVLQASVYYSAYAGVAQLVEQRIRNAKVAGSTPVSGTMVKPRLLRGYLFIECYRLNRIDRSTALTSLVRLPMEM